MSIEVQQRACPKCGKQMMVEVSVIEAYGVGRVREDVISGECPNGCELTTQDFTPGASPA